LFYTDFGKEAAGLLKDETFLKRISQETGQGYFYRGMDGSRFLVIYDVSAAEGWKLIKFIPASLITRNAKMNSRISLLTGIGFLLISIILVIITSNSITKPLNRLSKKMKAFGRGDFDIQSDISGSDELAQLSKQFNEMVTRINDLVNEQYKMKLVQKNAILKALEAELNPHFLYNALQAISTKALKSSVPEVGEMVDALALTLRYCIQGAEIVKVSDEIRHVENYLKIQKARYGNRLEVDYELDSTAMAYDIPKLSIQCLVENSIKHGLEAQSTVSRILVRVEAIGENARITVVDNGPGMEPGRLGEVLQSIQQEWSDGEYQNIGLKNLNTRLKLIFGDQAEMTIRSDARGTETAILIPERR
jgi:two-component system sensor histidine kinase YesM